MAGFYVDKAPHELHRTDGPKTFAHAFTNRTGISPIALAARYVAAGPDYEVLLGGSIPLGIGGPASDIDLIVMLDDIDRFALPPGDASTLVFPNSASDPVRAAVVLANGGLEIDIAMVDGRIVREAVRRALSDGVVPNLEERRLWGRFLTGWRLRNVEDAALDSILAARSPLQTRCSISSYIDALKRLEDARAALDDNRDVAIDLARVAIQFAFAAHFAAEGILSPGAKWLRLLTPDAVAAWSSAPSVSAELADRGISLNFPSRAATRREAADYVAAAAAFLTQTRAAIERERLLRIAYAVCPQIYDV